MYVSNRHFKGTIPDLSPLTELEHLTLISYRDSIAGRYGITGKFPDLSKQTKLRYFAIGGTFTGEFLT